MHRTLSPPVSLRLFSPLAAALLAAGAVSGAAAQGLQAPAADDEVQLRRPQTDPLTYPLAPIDPNQVPSTVGRVLPPSLDRGDLNSGE